MDSGGIYLFIVNLPLVGYKGGAVFTLATKHRQAYNSPHVATPGLREHRKSGGAISKTRTQE